MLQTTLHRRFCAPPVAARTLTHFSDAFASTVSVDYAGIAHNYALLRDHAGPGVLVVPTIKANAYGHGAVRVANACKEEGASYFAVANLGEALQLREGGVQDDVLVMSYIPPRFISLAAEAGITATVYDSDVLRAYGDALGGAQLKCHLKVDTGMGRLGALEGDVPAVLEALKHSRNFDVEGCLTHFSRADDDPEFCKLQLERFTAILDTIERAGFDLKYKHSGNSGATLLGSDFTGNMARVGIAMYGGRASTVADGPAGLRQYMQWTAEVAQVKTLPAGWTVGYGNTYVTPAPERVAMVPVGYADGFRRGPRNSGMVLIHGQRCPIRGRVSMEKTVVSVDHLPSPVSVGDEVVMLGRQGEEEITATEIGDTIGTIDYEVFTAAVPRQPR